MCLALQGDISEAASPTPGSDYFFFTVGSSGRSNRGSLNINFCTDKTVRYELNCFSQFTEKLGMPGPAGGYADISGISFLNTKVSIFISGLTKM